MSNSPDRGSVSGEIVRADEYISGVLGGPRRLLGDLNTFLLERAGEIDDKELVEFSGDLGQLTAQMAIFEARARTLIGRAQTMLPDTDVVEPVINGDTNHTQPLLVEKRVEVDETQVSIESLNGVVKDGGAHLEGVEREGGDRFDRLAELSPRYPVRQSFIMQNFCPDGVTKGAFYQRVRAAREEVGIEGGRGKEYSEVEVRAILDLVNLGPMQDSGSSEVKKN